MASDNSWKEHLRDFMDDYIDDMPDPTCFDAEIDLWGNLWLKDQKQLPQSIKEVMERKPKKGYSNINRVLHLLSVLPVTTCTCERSISALKRIKDYLRSTMHQVMLIKYFLCHQCFLYHSTVWPLLLIDIIRAWLKTTLWMNESLIFWTAIVLSGWLHGDFHPTMKFHP